MIMRGGSTGAVIALLLVASEARADEFARTLDVAVSGGCG
jgi:hypothetical protein